MNTPATIARIGIALYGAEEWQAPLARLLQVNPRTIRKIAQAARDGTPYAVNPHWLEELQPFVACRAAELEEAAARAKGLAGDLIAHIQQPAGVADDPPW